ncbi:hypothetical protein GCM10020295_53370 [Streptomyces cinereospinus]
MPEKNQTPAQEPAAESTPRRRQARGERRIAQLLEAAAAVFCSTGYTAASTNAIAREAGVSPARSTSSSRTRKRSRSSWATG